VFTECKLKVFIKTSVYPRDGFRLMINVIMGILQIPTHQYTIVIMKTIFSQKEIVFARRKKFSVVRRASVCVQESFFNLVFFDGCMYFSFFKNFLCFFIFIF
jgi:hypothetical protein